MKIESCCDVCSEKIEVEICCSGRECGCMGFPVEPPVCSKECYDKYMENKIIRTPTAFVKFKTTDQLTK